MAGSYNHCVGDNGRLLSSERMVWPGAMIENLGDAYEAIEEMYGMIWFLACLGPDAPSDMSPAALVELARTNHSAGLKLSEQHAEGKQR